MTYGCKSLVPAIPQIVEMEQRHSKERAYKEAAAKLEDGKTYCLTYTVEKEYKPELDAYELKSRLEITEPTIKNYIIGIDLCSRVKNVSGIIYRISERKEKRGTEENNEQKTDEKTK